MCDPDMVPCATPCPDWTDGTTTDTTVGDDPGHCCFLTDGHTTPPADTDWRTGANECQPPALQEPTC